MMRLKLRLLLAAAASMAIAAPAAAQDHSNMPGMTMPPKKATPKKTATKKPAAKKPATRRPAARKPVATKPAAKRPAAKKATAKPPVTTDDRKAGHDMSTMPAPPASTAGPHAGHDMSAMPDATPAGTDLPAGNALPPPVPGDHAADPVYGSGAMEMGRHHLQQSHGGQKLGQVMLNRAEVQARRGRDGFELDGEGWYGGDIDRLWVKATGEGELGRSVEQAELQALWSRAIDPYFNLQAGVRYDFKPNPSRAYAVIGVEGLAPGFFDVEGALFLSNKGELMARAEGTYDQRITQRLIAQPRAELNFAAQDSREIGVGSGLGEVEAGLRLRYEIRREFAPYIGVQYKRAFGTTRRYLRDEGEDTGAWGLVAGVRAWF